MNSVQAITPIASQKGKGWKIELLHSGLFDKKTPILVPYLTSDKIDDGAIFCCWYWHNSLIDIPASESLFKNNEDDLEDLRSGAANGWYLGARCLAYSATALFGVPTDRAFYDIRIAVEHGLQHGVQGYGDTKPIVLMFDVDNPTTVFSRVYANGFITEPYCAVKPKFMKEFALPASRESDTWFPLSMARHVMLQCLGKWMRGVKHEKQISVKGWFPTHRGSKCKPSAIIALFLAHLPPNHPQTDEFVFPYFDDLAAGRTPVYDKEAAVEACRKLEEVLSKKSLQHVVPVSSVVKEKKPRPTVSRKTIGGKAPRANKGEKRPKVAMKSPANLALHEQKLSEQKVDIKEVMMREEDEEDTSSDEEEEKVPVENPERSVEVVNLVVPMDSTQQFTTVDPFKADDEPANDLEELSEEDLALIGTGGPAPIYEDVPKPIPESEKFEAMQMLSDVASSQVVDDFLHSEDQLISPNASSISSDMDATSVSSSPHMGSKHSIVSDALPSPSKKRKNKRLTESDRLQLDAMSW